MTPDTILRWHRQRVAKKWDYSDRRQGTVGRPRLREKIVLLIVRMATENTGWGYDRIQGVRRALNEFEEFYHTERNHQGLGNNFIDFNEDAGSAIGPVQCRERLGGMLNDNYRDAA